MGTVELVETFEAAGKNIGDACKGGLCIIMIARMLGYHCLNKALGSVKNLSMLTHLMLLELYFPSITISFLKGFFSFVTFDVIPTEAIYNVLFGWMKESYSQ